MVPTTVIIIIYVLGAVTPTVGQLSFLKMSDLMNESVDNTDDVFVSALREQRTELIVMRSVHRDHMLQKSEVAFGACRIDLLTLTDSLNH